MKKSDIPFLNQLVKAIEEAESNLEKAYEKKDYENFTKAKKFIIQAQKKISEVVK